MSNQQKRFNSLSKHRLYWR